LEIAKIASKSLDTRTALAGVVIVKDHHEGLFGGIHTPGHMMVGPGSIWSKGRAAFKMYLDA
jgi:hypothetical protein